MVVADVVDREPEPTLKINLDDATRLAINPGDPLRVRSRRGELLARADVTARVAPGVVFANFHFPAAGNANNLTINAVDPVAKIPEYKVCAVAVEQLCAVETCRTELSESRQPAQRPLDSQQTDED